MNVLNNLSEVLRLLYLHFVFSRLIWAVMLDTKMHEAHIPVDRNMHSLYINQQALSIFLKNIINKWEFMTLKFEKQRNTFALNALPLKVSVQ